MASPTMSPVLSSFAAGGAAGAAAETLGWVRFGSLETGTKRVSVVLVLLPLMSTMLCSETPNLDATLERLSLGWSTYETR